MSLNPEECYSCQRCQKCIQDPQYRIMLLVLKVSKVPSIQSNVTHVRGVKSGVCGCIQSNVTHVGSVESELVHILCTALYEHKIKCWRGWKRLQIQNKGCNAIYIEGVKRSSKYTIMAHGIFAYNFLNNFLNIQLIFNLKKSFRKLRLRAFQPYHQKLCMLKHVRGVEGWNNLQQLWHT